MSEYRPNPETVLNYLYGLLDPPETVRVRAWLETPEGDTARRDAERVSGLFAAAAKSTFPEVRFEQPPAAVPAKTQQRPRASWASWFVAAAVLLCTGAPFAWHMVEDQRRRREADAAQRELDVAQKNLQDMRGQRDALLAAAQDRLDKAQLRFSRPWAELNDGYRKIQDDLRAKQLGLVISGPATVLPGAPNEFQIQTVDGANKPAAATITARIKDQKEQIVFEEKLARSTGTHLLKLPPDLPLTPGRDLVLEVTAQGDAGPKSELREQLPLAVPLYLTHLTTDKPMYQPGETVFFRSLILERFSLKPPSDEFVLQFAVQDPQQAETPIAAGSARLANNGAPVVGPDGQPVRGVGAGEWAIPANAPGGEYTLVVREASGRVPESKRKFLVNRYQPARLEKELEWSRKSYGPGDVVIANCKVSRAEGGAVARQPVQASAVVDGVAVPVEPVPATDDAGRVAVRFTLPKTIDRGAASLTVVFSDGANLESLNKPIPIVLKKLAIEFFPEGGDLVAGAPNRVYFQVRTTLGKPADLQGRIVDSTGKELARAATLTDDKEAGINQGMGRFEFTPEVGQRYKLKIDNPVGIEGEYRLPAAKAEGVVLTALEDVTADPAPLRVRVTSPAIERTLLIGAYARGRLLDHRRVTVAANATADVALKPESGVGGVTRITVFEEMGGNGSRRPLKPVAERLVYRKPTANLHLTVRPDRQQYVPGDKARLKLSATTETDQPTSALLYVGVVNQSVVTMADEKTARALPTHFLLTSEVGQPEDLEHADVLLGSHPKAAAALDHLLGTQGWRRFAEQTPDDFRKKAGDDGDRLCVLYGLSANQKRQADSFQLEAAKLAQTLAPELEAAQRAIVDANAALQSLQTDPMAADAERGLNDEVMAAVAAAGEAGGRLNELERSWQQTLDWLLPALCGLAMLGTIIALLLGTLRGVRWHSAALASLAVLVAVALGTIGHGVRSGKMESRQVAEATAKAPDEDRLRGALGELHKMEGQPLMRAGSIAENKPAAPEPKAPLALMVSPPAAAPAPVDGAKGDLKPASRAPAGAALRNAPRGKEKLIKEAERVAEARDKNQGKLIAGKDAVDELREAVPGDVKKNADRGGKAFPGLAFAPGVPPVQNLPLPVERINGRIAGVNAGGIKGGIGGGIQGFGDGNRGYFRIYPFVNNKGDQAMGGEVFIPQAAPFLVREYAYQHSQSPSEDRSDFAETLYWHPLLVVPKTGAEIAFDLSDSVTRYRVLAAGHTLDGRLGAITTHIEARKPLSIEPKLPVEITASDRVDVPVAIANDTDTARKLALKAEPKGLTLSRGDLDVTLSLAAQQRTRQLFRFQPTIKEGTAELRLTGRSDGANDSIVVPLPVVPEGFPVVGSISDVLERVAHHQIVLPPTWVPGTLKCQVSVFPSTLAELQRGLDGLLREPGGCFEQTSTTNYPNTLILEYLRESSQAEPEALRRAKGLLERGYTKLTSFEVPENSKREGFEWFGQAPAHEALTAYGLMQFRDMAQVSDVDPELLRRTREFLLSRRDGKGGFQRNARALDTFGRAPDEVTNAYIIWALTEGSKEDDIAKELNALAAQAKQSKDPYFLALVANALLNRDRAEEAIVHLKALTAALTKDGYLDGAQTSITGSSGRMLQIETTALAVLGWLKANRPGEFAPAVRAAVSWIGKQRGGYGGFGSTQSTILALKALIAYTKANKQTPESGDLTLFLGDQVISRLPFAAGTSGELTIAVPDADKRLKPSKNDLRVEITGKNNYPYTLTWSYQTLQPPSAEGCAVRLDVKLNQSDLAEGDSTQLKMTLENVSGKGQGMAVAILGLPAGLKLPDDFKQLKDLARLRPDGKAGAIGAFELRGRELVLYWRDLAPDAKIDLAIDLRGHVPGEYTGPASRAYLYYNPDAKCWAAPVAATIRAKD